MALALSAALILLGTLVLWSSATYQAAVARKEQTVRGSYERYIANRQAALAATASIVFYMLLGVAFGLLGFYVMSIIMTVATACWIQLLKKHLEDDDWYDSQRKRFERGLKKIHSRLVGATPRFTPSPNPT